MTYPSAVANAIEKALVAALADVIKVPVSFGIVIVLSAVGSTTVKVVSCASAVAPSNMILASVRFNAVAVKDSNSRRVNCWTCQSLTFVSV